jgi:putative ABC transport system permease protein
MNPPRLARFVVSCLAPGACRQTLLDDLDEAFERRAAMNAAAARRWYRRQARASVWPLLAMRWRGRADTVHLSESSISRTPLMLDSALHDVRYAIRLLRRSPTFTLTAAATIALGIGANAAIFAVVQGLLLRPLPYPHADRLVTVWQDMRERGGPADEWATPGTFLDWRNETSIFESASAMRGWGPTLTGDGDPEPLVGEQVTHEYFDVLSVAPARGRAFHPDDDVPNAGRVVVIGHELWQRRFGGDEAVLGRRILLSGEPHEVIGVMPPTFKGAFISDAELWRPARLNLATPSRGAIVLRVVARTRSHPRDPALQSAVSALGARLASLHPQSVRTTVSIVPLHEFIVGDVRPGLIAVFTAVVLVLLIACVNIASLMLARASARTREFAVRTALGAGRRRVARQLLTESLVLAGAGAAAGVAISVWAVDALVALAPAGTPRLDEITFDAGVVAFASGMAVVAAVIFGLAPAWQLARAGGVAPALKDGGRGAVGPSGHHLRRALIVVEVALALVLLVGGGLLVRSFVEMRRVDLGFDPSNVLVGFVGAPPARYPTPELRLALIERAIDASSRLPGVTTAAATSVLPLATGDNDLGLDIEGRPPTQTPEDQVVAWYRLVSDRYFDAMGIRITRGRAFVARESAPAVVVTESFARRYWPDANAVGKRVRPGGGPDTPWFTVVGITADVKQQGARAEPRLQIFVPYWQVPSQAGGMNLVLKTAVPAETLTQPLRRTILALDPDLPVAAMTTMESVVDESLSESRFLALLVGVFAGLATLVAVIGVYGLMSYAVTSRRAEIGVRVALGAERRAIFGLVMTEGVRLALVGVGIGVAASVLLAPLLDTLLFGVRPADPLTIATMAAAFVAIAMLAAAVPARRATQVNPIVALRGE